MAVGRLGIASPASSETRYRRDLRRHAADSFARLNNDIDADLSDLEEVMIAAFVLFIEGVDRYNTRQIRVTFEEFFGDNRAPFLIEEALSADVVPDLDAARRANVDLIKDIGAEQRRKIRDAIRLDGTTDVPLVDEINKVLPQSRTRARLIARDQTAKINTSLSRARHVAAGSTGYNWRTVGDERVRPDHDAVDGNRYAYGETTGTDSGAPPGQDVQCRCVEDPII